ncbi:hypothetical protein PO002_41835 [Cupriavidus necator]|uniref:hypothetical protein n=1 Tax=Cupriavidus necator TaxID=106590 RepID=UPI0039C3FBFD
MKRILCSLLVASLPFGSVLAEAPKSQNAKGGEIEARKALSGKLLSSLRLSDFLP